MNSVWYVLPSAMPPPDCNAAYAPWVFRGYRIAVFRDEGKASGVVADIVIQGQYRGWYDATNQLYAAILERYPDTEWIVSGGEDMSPDANHHASQIARECTEHFHGTFGVMQPVGDPWAPDESGRVAAERICGSPWVGRDFIRRYNGGKGVWPEGYRHFFGDEQLREELYGTLLWQRRDLCQFHNHWIRANKQPPPWMKDMKEMWAHDEALFKERKAAEFPRLPTLP